MSSLIKMPYGCGEQNMINFAPNVYILQYLTKTRQLREDIKSKAVSFMRKGLYALKKDVQILKKIPVTLHLVLEVLLC